MRFIRGEYTSKGQNNVAEKVHGFILEMNSQGMDLGIWFCKLSTSEEINVGSSVCIGKDDKNY